MSSWRTVFSGASAGLKPCAAMRSVARGCAYLSYTAHLTEICGVEWVLIVFALLMQAPTQRPAPMPALPLTQLDERVPAGDLDSRTFTLTFAQPVPVRDLLLLLVRGTSLSMVPDPAIGGTFIGELKNITVRQALQLILEPLGFDYTVDRGIVRVFRREPETRIFDLNYVATERAGQVTVGGEGAARSNASVASTTRTDVFQELSAGIRTLLTERATFNVDRKAGLLQVTDFPERLDRVAIYLDAVRDRVHRQVQIDARVIEVEITDAKAPGIDWAFIAAKMSGAATADVPVATRQTMNGLRVSDAGKLLGLLGEQGTVTTMANPRLLTLNNETSIVRTDTMSFSVTPQIAGDSVLTLSLTPMLKAPAVVESDMLARVADGETLVISGFTRDRETKEKKAAGINGGWFGRSTVVTRKRVELVILLTARIIAGVAAQ
jgi:type II secretory pathway component GspD/PulD (secretin)